ncbi:hypothetical protein V9K67_21475 [Paraflavisolibacter sp. H34]|uniref:hypothetical protein n=1 Tax=Huijunlia imazamoxiresistens TaxID=3127457 RepID=UPI0030196453
MNWQDWFGRNFAAGKRGPQQAENKAAGTEFLKFVPTRKRVPEDPVPTSKQAEAPSVQSPSHETTVALKSESQADTPLNSSYPSPLSIIRKAVLRSKQFDNEVAGTSVEHFLQEMLQEGRLQFVYRSEPREPEVIPAHLVEWRGNVLLIRELDDSPGFRSLELACQLEGEEERRRSGEARRRLEHVKNAAPTDKPVKLPAPEREKPEQLSDETQQRNRPENSRIQGENNAVPAKGKGGQQATLDFPGQGKEKNGSRKVDDFITGELKKDSSGQQQNGDEKG